jgi:hypothetical protein
MFLLRNASRRMVELLKISKMFLSFFRSIWGYRGVMLMVHSAVSNFKFGLRILLMMKFWEYFVQNANKGVDGIVGRHWAILGYFRHFKDLSIIKKL